MPLSRKDLSDAFEGWLVGMTYGLLIAGPIIVALLLF